MKLELKNLVPYLPYGLEVLRFDNQFKNGFNKHTLNGLTEDFRYKKDDLDDDDDTDLLNIKQITFWVNEGFGLNNIAHDIKPILRPLSDLTKGDLDYLINHHSTDWFADTEMERVIDRNLRNNTLHHFIEFLPYGLVCWLIEKHYDIFGLIEQELAIDINTL